MKPRNGARPVPDQNMSSGVSVLRGSLKRAFEEGQTETCTLSPGLRIERYFPVTPAKLPWPKRVGPKMMLYVIVALVGEARGEKAMEKFRTRVGVKLARNSLNGRLIVGWSSRRWRTLICLARISFSTTE